MVVPAFTPSTWEVETLETESKASLMLSTHSTTIKLHAQPYTLYFSFEFLFFKIGSYKAQFRLI